MREGQASGETGLEERTILLPTGQHSESNGTEKEFYRDRKSVV